MRTLPPALAFTLKLLLGLGLLAAAASLVDFNELRLALGRVDPLMYSAAAALSVFGTIILPAISTRGTLQIGGINLGLWQLVRINLAMRFYVLTLPHAATVGIRWHRYNRGQGRGWEIAALILFERVAQLLAVSAFALVFLIAGLKTLPQGLLVLVPISALLSTGGLVLLMVFVSPRAFSLVDPWIDAACRRLPAWIATRVRSLRSAIASYQDMDARRLGLVLTCAAGWYLCMVASGYIASESLGTGLHFAEIGWMRSTVFLLTLLPVTVGGIGVREAGFAVLFEIYGVGYATGLAFGLVLLSIQLLIGMAGLLAEARSISRDLQGARNARNQR